jgi:hypothetical protein
LVLIVIDMGCFLREMYVFVAGFPAGVLLSGERCRIQACRVVTSFLPGVFRRLIFPIGQRRAKLEKFFLARF